MRIKPLTNRPKLSVKQLQKLHDRLLMEQTERCQNEPIFDKHGNLYRFADLLKNNKNFTPISLPNNANKLFKPNKCYVCKQPFVELHPFYHRLCPSCAEQNFAYRTQTADLTGRVALVTGGRIKIGFEIALKLLRAGATVLVTTRFVQDAIKRYREQADFADWQQRLQIVGLDLKYPQSVEAFTEYVKTHFASLDIIINNATQTLRKPIAFYEYRATQEQYLLPQQTAFQQLLGDFNDSHLALDLQRYQQQAVEHHICHQLDNANKLSVVNPKMALDEFAEPIDFSAKNSWVKNLDEIDTLEMLEAQLINATAPFILNARLKSLMQQSPFAQRFIINVSAMEGQFNRNNKTHKHPHTNMAKASLNMMTRTSAQDYAQDQIYMNSVDTGWVTQENPFAIRQRSRLNGMIPPLDCVDGASRVLAPIFDMLIHSKDSPEFGRFFKDYQPCAW